MKCEPRARAMSSGRHRDTRPNSTPPSSTMRLVTAPALLVLATGGCGSIVPDDAPTFGEIQAKAAMELFASIGPLYHTAFGHPVLDGVLANGAATSVRCEPKSFGVWNLLIREEEGYSTSIRMPGLQTLTITESLGGGTTVTSELFKARPCRFSPGFLVLVPWEEVDEYRSRPTVFHEVAYPDGSNEWQGRWTGYFLWQQEHTKEDGRCDIDVRGSGTVERFVRGNEPGSVIQYRGTVCDQDVEIDIDVTAGRRSNCFTLSGTRLGRAYSWQPTEDGPDAEGCVRSP